MLLFKVVIRPFSLVFLLGVSGSNWSIWRQFPDHSQDLNRKMSKKPKRRSKIKENKVIKDLGMDQHEPQASVR